MNACPGYEAQGLGSSPGVKSGFFSGRDRFKLTYIFGQLDITGKNVLDVGAGTGLAAVFAGLQGAAKVVALEPECAGGHSKMRAAFRERLEHTGVRQVELVGLSFQEYCPHPDRFDIILLHNSVNHLDEDACKLLQHDHESRETYRSLFAKMRAMLQPGGAAIVHDCAPSNFYRDIGVTNPFAPTIDWTKHQPPELWADLMSEVGFDGAQISWTSPSKLRSLGRFLAGNRLAAYLLRSHFRLLMRKGQQDEA